MRLLLKILKPFIVLCVHCAVIIVAHTKPIYYRICGKRVLQSVARKGIDCRIHGPITIVCPELLTLGDYVRIGWGCYFYCTGGLTVGHNTQISRHVTIYTGNHDTNGTAVPYDINIQNKPVRIGDSVWIGMNVCIVPGVTIGDGAVIGMGTVVSKDVPAGGVVVGSPQRIVKTRDMSKFQEHSVNGRLFGKLWPDA